MALLSPGASRQSPLYHMAIISVVLLCGLLTLSAVTCDPLQPNQPMTRGSNVCVRIGVGVLQKQRGAKREREGGKGGKNERQKNGSMW